MSNWGERFDKRPRRTVLNIGLSFIAIFAVLGIFGWIVAPMYSAVTAPGRVVTRTLETDNIINNYEWFFDATAQISARVSQIAAHRAILADTTLEGEKSRLRIELAAQQQSCRDLLQRYNANAMKLNDGLFRDWRLPRELNPTMCE